MFCIYHYLGTPHTSENETSENETEQIVILDTETGVLKQTIQIRDYAVPVLIETPLTKTAYFVGEPLELRWKLEMDGQPEVCWNDIFKPTCAHRMVG